MHGELVCHVVQDRGLYQYRPATHDFFMRTNNIDLSTMNIIYTDLTITALKLHGQHRKPLLQRGKL